MAKSVGQVTVMITLSVESAEIVLKALSIVQKLDEFSPQDPLDYDDQETEKINSIRTEAHEFVKSLDGKTLGFRL